MNFSPYSFFLDVPVGGLVELQAFISFYAQICPPHVKAASKRRSCSAVVF